MSGSKARLSCRTLKSIRSLFQRSPHYCNTCYYFMPPSDNYYCYFAIPRWREVGYSGTAARILPKRPKGGSLLKEPTIIREGSEEVGKKVFWGGLPRSLVKFTHARTFRYLSVASWATERLERRQT